MKVNDILRETFDLGGYDKKVKSNLDSINNFIAQNPSASSPIAKPAAEARSSFSALLSAIMASQQEEEGKKKMAEEASKLKLKQEFERKKMESKHNQGVGTSFRIDRPSETGDASKPHQ